MRTFADLKSIVEAEVCPVHHQHPIIQEYDKKVSVVCCCQDFEIATNMLMIILMQVLTQKKPLKVAWKKTSNQ